MPANVMQDNLDHVREQAREARIERDQAMTALAEIEAVPTDEWSDIATVLRRFRIGLSTPRRMQYDRLVREARQARRARYVLVAPDPETEEVCA